MVTDAHLAVPPRHMHAPPGPPPVPVRGATAPLVAAQERKSRRKVRAPATIPEASAGAPCCPPSSPAGAQQSCLSPRAGSPVSSTRQAATSAPPDTPSFLSRERWPRLLRQPQPTAVRLSPCLPFSSHRQDRANPTQTSTEVLLSPYTPRSLLLAGHGARGSSPPSRSSAPLSRTLGSA